MIQLVAFLGNYGHEYANTRHNTAWLFEKSLPFANRISYSSKFKSEFAQFDFENFAGMLADCNLLKKRDDGSLILPKEFPPKIYFIKPQTYMNLSGDAIGELCRFYKLKPDEVLVVHDEIELPLGTVGFKFGGGLGGHNGLRSTKDNLGTADFYRLRFGIGKPSHGDIAGYVLGNFTIDEQITLSHVFSQVHELFAKSICSSDPLKLTQPWNKKKLVD